MWSVKVDTRENVWGKVELNNIKSISKTNIFKSIQNKFIKDLI